MCTLITELIKLWFTLCKCYMSLLKEIKHALINNMSDCKIIVIYLLELVWLVFVVSETFFFLPNTSTKCRQPCPQIDIITRYWFCLMWMNILKFYNVLEYDEKTLTKSFIWFSSCIELCWTTQIAITSIVIVEKRFA